MRGSYCYMPILPARFGAFRAVANLSPLARTRISPMFDIPNIKLKDDATVDDFLQKRADHIRDCWGYDRPFYLDAYSVSLDWQTKHGESPLVFALRYLRALGTRPIPVTGTAWDRGTSYLESVKGLVGGDGVCIRLAREEVFEPSLLRSSLADTLALLQTPESNIDVILDCQYIGDDDPHTVRSATLDALLTVHSLGSFRNLGLAASCIPNSLSKRDEGRVRRESRKDIKLWSEVLNLVRGTYPLPFCDYGVVGARYVPPGKPVHTPARIRYTTENEHIFLRGKRDRHHEIAKQLVALTEFRGRAYSVGDQRLWESSERRLGLGTAALWVGYDGNHHMELVSKQVWETIEAEGAAAVFSLPQPHRTPWLQPELFEL